MLKASDNSSLDLNRFMSLWKDFKANVLEGEETEDEIKSAFKTYDINGDGYITKDEMVSVNQDHLEQLPTLCTDLFQVMTNMGFVSNKEEEAAKCIDEMDLDGDGRVSYAEFMVKWKVT